VRVGLNVGDDHVAIHIADNGQGFPFRGRYGHAILKTLRLAPVTLAERVEALQGDLTIESSDNGSDIDIVVPRAALEKGRA